MIEIHWDERVQVQILEPVGMKNYRIVEEDVVIWDDLRFAEAVGRCMRLSPKKRASVRILTTSGCYSGSEIEALYHQSPE
jgi:hypothetical protein